MSETPTSATSADSRRRIIGVAGAGALAVRASGVGGDAYGHTEAYPVPAGQSGYP